MNELQHILTAARDERSLTLQEAVDRVNSALPYLAPEQERGTVRDTLDARTVRYYTTRGLLPGPVAYEGGRARYSAEHILRLLLIKRLQAEHHSLRTIDRLICGLTVAEVERALGGAPLESLAQPGPSGATAPATPSRDPSPLLLSPGGAVTVPEHILNNSALRLQLAHSLEALASWLRSTAEDPR